MKTFKRSACMHCYTQCPQPCSRPPPTYASTRDSWTLMGMSGSVSCGVTAPFSWVLVCRRFCLCPQSLFPQSCVSSGGSMVGLMVTSSKKAYTIPRSTAPRAPAPAADHRRPAPPQETLTHSSVCLCGVPGSWCTQGLFEHSERLLREWDLILNTNSPLLPSCWGFSFALGCGVSPQSHSTTAQPSTYCLAGASLPLDMGYLLFLVSNILQSMVVQQ